MMKKRTKVIGKDFKVFFHFDLCANGIVELDEPGEDEKASYKIAGGLVEEFLHKVDVNS